MMQFCCMNITRGAHADGSWTGYNVVCIMAFKSLADMTFFMKGEPAHHELKASVAGKLAKGVWWWISCLEIRLPCSILKLLC